MWHITNLMRTLTMTAAVKLTLPNITYLPTLVKPSVSCKATNGKCIKYLFLDAARCLVEQYVLP